MTRTARAALAAVVLGASGCGGGGSSGPAVPEGRDYLAEGRASLNAMASSDTVPEASRLHDARSLFELALAGRPSPEAHLGAAVMAMGLVGLEPLDDQDPGPPRPPDAAQADLPPDPPHEWTGPMQPHDLPPAPPDFGQPPTVKPPRVKIALLWRLLDGVRTPYAAFRMVEPVVHIRQGLTPQRTRGAAAVARRMAALERLDAILAHLDKVEQDAGFRITLPRGEYSVVPVAVELPEVLLFDSQVSALRAELAFSLAYVREAAGGPTGPARALDRNSDGRLTPDEHLPPEPFLNLRDPALLAKARESMLRAADKGMEGVAGVLARPEDSRFLVPNIPAVRPALLELRDHALPTVRKAATQLVALRVPRPVLLLPNPNDSDRPPPPPDWLGDDLAVLVKLNLPAWFSSPPKSLRPLAPTYDLRPGIPLRDRAVFPDATFAGLFPEGLPDALLR